MLVHQTIRKITTWLTLTGGQFPNGPIVRYENFFIPLVEMISIPDMDVNHTLEIVIYVLKTALQP